MVALRDANGNTLHVGNQFINDLILEILKFKKLLESDKRFRHITPDVFAKIRIIC